MSKFNPLDHPICFSRPLRLARTAELAHVPFAMFLVDILTPGALVQLGVSEGTLFCAYAQAVRQLRLSTRCFAVGSWANGDSEPGDPLSLANLKAHHDPLYGNFSQLLQVMPGEAHTNFENGAVDLLHISGRSSSGAPEDWIKNWLPRMSDRGVIVLDSIHLHESESHLWKVWQDLKAQRPHFEFAHHGGLGVLSIGANPPDRLEVLLKANDKEKSLIREFFEQSGELLLARLTNDPEVETLHRKVRDFFLRLEAKTGELEEKDWTIESLQEEIEVADRTREENRKELDELYTQIADLSVKETKLNDILNSRAWRWVSRYGTLKMRLVSPRKSQFQRPLKEKSRVWRAPEIPPQIPVYDAWLEVNKWNEKRKRLLVGKLSHLAETPLLTIVMPLDGSSSEFLNNTLEGVAGQVYQNWELLIVAGPGIDPGFESTLANWKDRERRIRVVSGEEVKSAVSMPADDGPGPRLGGYLIFISPGDEISPAALAEVALYLETKSDVEILFSDEDKIDAKGHRSDPTFKSEWLSNSTLADRDPGNLIVMRKDLFLETWGTKAEIKTDLVSQAIARATRLAHIPKMLYHRRELHESTEEITTDLNYDGQPAHVGPLISARTSAPQTLPPIRTLMCAFNLNLEGAPHSQFEMTVKLKQKGIVEPLVYSPVDGPLRHEYEREGIEVKVRTHPLTGVAGPSQYETRIDAFARSIKNWQAELVYGNTLQTFYAIEAAHRLNLPSVWNPRESEPWETYFDFLPPGISDRGLRCFAYPYQVVFVSNATAQAYQRLNSHHNFMVIHNGLNRERFDAALRKVPRPAARRQLKVPDQEILFLLVGTICERKGQIDLARAVSKLPEHIALRCKFMIVGDRESSYSEEIKKAVRRLPFPRRFRFDIIPETSDVGLFYTAADCFVCTSRVESFPRVILEALAAGLPIITTPVFGIAEQVKQDISAVFYEPGDVEGLAGAIVSMVENAELRQRLASNTGPALDSLIDFETMVDAYGQIFREAWVSGSSRVG